MEYYSGIREKKILSFQVTWTKLEIIILSQLNKAPKDKYHMISFIYGIQKL